MQPLKVFISSTYLDLKDYRQTAIEVVNRYKCVPLAMEFFLAQPAEPSRVAEKEVRECDIFVGLYAHRFGFDAVKALFPKMPPDRLWELLQGLQQLGLVFYDKGQQQAVVYFQARPAPEKVVTLADLEPVIERYHHLIGAGKFDEARDLYRDRLENPIYYQLANYNLQIELLRALFPEGEDHPPRLQKKAEHCLSEALRRCRSVNLIEVEPDLLLAWARLERKKAKGKEQKASSTVENLNPVEEYVKEAREIAERAGYRLQLADIHLFCAEVGLERQKENSKKQKEKTNTNSFLGLSIKEHLQKAREYALDVSEYAHLYQSTDPHFYDGVPEAAMLKRGLTEQERIDNGYWVAYQIALALEQRLAAQR